MSPRRHHHHHKQQGNFVFSQECDVGRAKKILVILHVEDTKSFMVEIQNLSLHFSRLEGEWYVKKSFPLGFFPKNILVRHETRTFRL